MQTVQTMSRLKKKLLLYFILIAIVSITVSAEIILEMSSPSFRTEMSRQLCSQLKGVIPDAQIARVQPVFSRNESWAELFNLRNRMILLLLVISASVIGAFFLFTKDIVSPMDGLVAAAQKIAKGDFTATAPVMSKDEIGQLAMLLNDMNINLQDMIIHIKRELSRHKEKIESAAEKNDLILRVERAESILASKKISLSSFRNLVELNDEIKVLLWRMNNDVASLEAYISSYKTYSIPSEITQHEIEESILDFKKTADKKSGSEA